MNLKKHILSYFAYEYSLLTDNDSVEKNDEDKMEINNNIGPTRVTESIETSDPDGFDLIGPTSITRSVETSDPDDLVVEPTKSTYTVETSDPDSLVIEPTKSTYIVEISDYDSFVFY